MLSPEFTAGIIAFFVSLLSMPIIRSVAIRYHLYDQLSARKVHSSIIPRLGGVGLFIAIILAISPFFELSRPLVALLLSASLLFGVGIIDDIRGLKPITKLIAQVISALIVLTGGIGIVTISIPILGSVLRLDNWQIPIKILGDTYNIIPLANAITVAWIVVIINAINLLDGLDGLAAGVSMIALMTLAILLGPGMTQHLVLLLAIASSMSLLGFLVSNFNPARIFMGDSGAYLIGLLVAVLPIYSTSKTAIGVLVIGLAIVDLVWAVLRRFKQGKSPFSADRGHLHHKLLDSGIKHRTVVIIFYIVAIITSIFLIVDQFVNAILALIFSVILLSFASRIK